jgi:hypothetical protein
MLIILSLSFNEVIVLNTIHFSHCLLWCQSKIISILVVQIRNYMVWSQLMMRLLAGGI